MAADHKANTLCADELLREARVNSLLNEARVVAGNLNRLNEAMAADEFPKLPRAEKDLLYSQQRAMSRYVQILGKRLELAQQPFTHADES